MKKLKLIKRLLFILIVLTGFLFSSVAFAAKPKIILFCSSWHSKCREARAACSYASADTKPVIKYTELDIDAPATEQKAAKLRLKIPPAIPYIYILDSHNKVIKKNLYKGESPEEFKKQILNALHKN